ncbi:PTS sugar transporter subunit IIA [Secundilactobacillus kimchicus]|uniref:PTS sugar transporter subunit IIA n=1 Tax=Secundilactobacillus kimchicus TaxID=528209 RepID=UPI0024A93BDA|nr:PTS sugar transporter subunit IIA [Secundilactobacillus kimchicus]
MTRTVIVVDKPEITDIETFMQVVEEIALRKKLIQAGNNLRVDIKAREAMGNTRIGVDTVMPHVKAEYVIKPTVLIIRVRQPLTWQDQLPARVFIILLVREPDPFLEDFIIRLVNEDFIDELADFNQPPESIRQLVIEGRK